MLPVSIKSLHYHFFANISLILDAAFGISVNLLHQLVTVPFFSIYAFIFDKINDILIKCKQDSSILSHSLYFKDKSDK